MFFLKFIESNLPKNSINLLTQKIEIVIKIIKGKKVSANLKVIDTLNLHCSVLIPFKDSTYNKIN